MAEGRSQVIGVDRSARTVELLRPDNTRARVRVSDKVRKFDAVKPGDTVITTKR